MNYEKQASDFMTKVGATMTIKTVGKQKYFHSDTKPRIVYDVTIRRGDRPMTFLFGDSYANTEKNAWPTEYSILACLTKYEPPETVDDFIKEYGYKISNYSDALRAKDTFDAVWREWTKVLYVFGDVLDELREID